MEPLKFDIIHQVMDDKGYRVLTSGVYNLNLIAVRAEDRRSAFPDQLHIFYRGDKDSRFKHHNFDINTCTGKHPVFNPWNVFECDILVPGQYRNAFKLLKDDCLQQQVPMNFVHDEWPGPEYNLDLYSTFEKRRANSMYVNLGADLICAHSLKKALGINYYRGGLQVLKNFKDLDIVLWLAEQHVNAGHGLISYTLLEEGDFA